jgi:hypothetical protein
MMILSNQTNNGLMAKSQAKSHLCLVRLPRRAKCVSAQCSASWIKTNLIWWLFSESINDMQRAIGEEIFAIPEFANWASKIADTLFD